MAVKHLQLTEELLEKASLFAAGALPEDERREYLRHLEEDDCDVCRNEARELQSAANFLSLHVPLETPSPRVKERLMERVRLSAVVMPMPRPRRWLEWTAGLIAVAASIALVFVLNDNAQLRRLTDSLTSRVAQLESQLSGQRARLAALSSPSVRVVNLAGQGANTGASGRVFWDQAKRRWFFYAQNLPSVASDKSYQLWFVPVTGNPVSATVFNTDSLATDQSVTPSATVPFSAASPGPRLSWPAARCSQLAGRDDDRRASDDARLSPCSLPSTDKATTRPLLSSLSAHLCICTAPARLPSVFSS